MVKCCVFFAVRTEFLNIIYSFDQRVKIVLLEKKSNSEKMTG
jgi:hypothetical protein